MAAGCRVIFSMLGVLRGFRAIIPDRRTLPKYTAAFAEILEDERRLGTPPRPERGVVQPGALPRDLRQAGARGGVALVAAS